MEDDSRVKTLQWEARQFAHKEYLERHEKWRQTFPNSKQVHISAIVMHEAVQTQTSTSSHQRVMRQESHQLSTVPKRTQASKTYENISSYVSMQGSGGEGTEMRLTIVKTITVVKNPHSHQIKVTMMMNPKQMQGDHQLRCKIIVFQCRMRLVEMVIYN